MAGAPACFGKAVRAGARGLGGFAAATASEEAQAGQPGSYLPGEVEPVRRNHAPHAGFSGRSHDWRMGRPNVCG